MNRFLTIFLALALFSCQPASKDQAGAQGQAPEQQQAASNPPAKGEHLYPSVPLDTLTMLWEQCDFIDYVFYYTNFSVSQNTKEDIRNAIRFISEEVPLINPDCKPLGRLFFQVEGENRLEADLYFNEGCTYFVFLDKGKPAYANSMMPSGINFFNNVFTSATTAPQSH
ncbi:MAG: hypothetical protein KDC66_07905 [Phaeodactylibacter sp.]|nr:hypothetical protein [Phaeodactylibacter sp.]MCB9275606.1 hypothetical protein [Lewinellaceae bacterium]